MEITQNLGETETDHRFEQFTDFFQYRISETPLEPYYLDPENGAAFVISQLDYLKTTYWQDGETEFFPFMDPLNRTIFEFFYSITTNFKHRSNIDRILKYHFDHCESLDKRDFLDFIEWALKQLYPEVSEYNDTVLKIFDWLKEKRENVKDLPVKLEKIKWNGNTAMIGFIFNELATKGYILPPQTRGKTSWEKFAKILYKYFEIEGAESTLIREIKPETPYNPKTKGGEDRPNSLSDKNREQFHIPYLKELQ